MCTLEPSIFYNTQKMDNVPELYEIFKGEVANVTDYGAFIKIPGCTKQGLAYRTHMPSSHLTIFQK